MIKQKKKICLGCNTPQYIFSWGKCKTCYNKYYKKPIKKSNKPIKKISEKGLEKKKLKSENTKKLHNWFQELWKNEPHYSEISGKWLGDENSSCFWHHILPKNSHKKAEFDRENIIRLTFEEHQEVEQNPLKFEEVNKRRKILKEKYGKL